MPYSNHRSGKQCAGRSGFTLIELLIVVGIITILIVLGLSVAGKVAGGGKARATEQTLRVLDQALTEFIQSTGGNPPAYLVDPRPTNSGGKYVQPIFDGRCESSTQMVNSVGYFLTQCKSVPAAAAALKHLDSRFLREYTPDPTVAGWETQHAIPTAFDAWGNPIRYVHPQSKGLIGTPPGNPTTAVNITTILGPPPPGKSYGITMIRRNNVGDGSLSGASQPDSDGGINGSPRPYFYSAGPDGQVGQKLDASGNVLEDYNKDNIYLTVPRFQKPS